MKQAYPCVAEAFPERPDNSAVAYLDGLPATEEALTLNLTINPNNTSRGREFALPGNHYGKIHNIKAAMAQAHGDASG